MIEDSDTVPSTTSAESGGARDKITSLAHDARDKASSLATAARDRGSDLAASARDGAGRAVGSTSDLIREHPIAATAVALGAGALIGVMLPRVRLGMAATSAVRKTARMAATAETVRTISALLAAAGEKARTGAHDLSDRIPALEDIRDAAARGAARAGDAVDGTRRQVADSARKVADRLRRD